jgi:hypothetical protein
MRNVTHQQEVRMPQARQYADNAAKQRTYRARQADARRSEQSAKGLPPAPPLSTLPSQARWQALLARAMCYLETLRDELQAYHDARSETWQEGERAAAFLEQIESLEQALEALSPDESARRQPRSRR